MALPSTLTYAPLTEQEAIVYAKQHKLIPQDADVHSIEIGDGNLNLVFHLTYEDKGIIIKQALPYAKVVGESWPLTLHRATIEATALQTQARYAPDLVPAVLHTDSELAVTVLEDLSRLTISRTGLINGEAYPELGKDVGIFLAKTLFHTSDYALHPFEKKKLAHAFYNPELCKITEDLVFTDPFFESDTNDFEETLRPSVEELWANEPLKLEVAKLKKSFLTESEALLHGDLHTGSIFASNEETKIIDPEFAFYGPIGFDIGQFIANLTFQLISREENKDVISAHITTVWHTFVEEFSALWKEHATDSYATVPGYLNHVLAKTWQDAIGFAGCELIRRTIGLAHVADLDSIQPDERRVERKAFTLKTGQHWIQQRSSIQSIEQLLETIR